MDDNGGQYTTKSLNELFDEVITETMHKHRSIHNCYILTVVFYKKALSFTMVTTKLRACLLAIDCSLLTLS